MPEEGDTIYLIKDGSPLHELVSDPEAFAAFIIKALSEGARKEREENDRLGIPTPVNTQGKVGCVLRGKIVTPELK